MKLPDGVTLRQLHYWLAQGYLPAEGLQPGTGHPRNYTEDRMRMLRVMGKLRLAGIEAPQAGKFATESLSLPHGEITVIISPGVALTVDLDALLEE